MSKTPTVIPTLLDLVNDPMKVTALPPKELAMLGAAVIYGLLTDRAEQVPVQQADDGGEWVGVREAVEATGYPRRWFFRRRQMPFCKSPSRKHLLVNLDKLRRAIKSGDVKAPTTQQGESKE